MRMNWFRLGDEDGRYTVSLMADTAYERAVVAKLMQIGRLQPTDVVYLTVEGPYDRDAHLDMVALRSENDVPPESDRSQLCL